jgi:hypothetical protein
MLRRVCLFTVGNWGSTNAGFTMYAGFADTTTLHTFTLLRFTDMLLSPLDFSARLVSYPKRFIALNLLPLKGYLMNTEAAHLEEARSRFVLQIIVQQCKRGDIMPGNVL